jgi:hypothetical protein
LNNLRSKKPFVLGQKFASRSDVGKHFSALAVLLATSVSQEEQIQAVGNMLSTVSHERNEHLHCSHSVQQQLLHDPRCTEHFQKPQSGMIGLLAQGTFLSQHANSILDLLSECALSLNNWTFFFGSMILEMLMAVEDGKQ